MSTKRLFAVLLVTAVCSGAIAQNSKTQKDKDDFFGKESKEDFFGKDDKDDFFSKNDKGFAGARQQMYDEFNKFRKEALKEYSDFVRKAWKDYKASPAVEAPKDEMVVPQLAPGADEQTASWFSKQMDKLKAKLKKEKKPVPPEVANPLANLKAQGKAETKKPVELPVQEVLPAEPVLPKTEPQIEAVNIEKQANGYMSFEVFGTLCKVRMGEDCKFTLADVTSNTVADAIENVFSKKQFENMLYDCLQERKNHDFSDWAYYQMLLSLTRKFYGEDSNEAVLAQAFLYSQSGYKMRLAHDDSHLYMLAATRHFIYNKLFYSIDGDWYFLLSSAQPEKLGICQASFPKESSLSLQISAAQRFAMNPTNQRTIMSRKNPSFQVTISSNKNYIDFYETYPSSTVNNNFMTRWAMYANTPIEEGVRNQLYPQLKALMQGMSQAEAVQQLLWWMHGNIDLEGVIQDPQTFLYRYDEDIWGRDRAFFGEETLFYPYCDCEDRSILLSHLVRDLVGLDVILVHYPGHLAMAVNFTEDVQGDYLMYDGKKYIVCDPTYVGSRIGETMPNMIGLETTVILLQKS